MRGHARLLGGTFGRVLRAAGLAVALQAAWLTAPAAAADQCTCQELRDYVKTVEKKLECYKKAHAAAQDTFYFTQSDSVAVIETCMGWVQGSAKSTGKPDTAPAEEVKEAKDNCRAKLCDWICDVAVDEVHEKAHKWFDRTHRMSLVLLLAHGPILGRTAMQVDNNFGEMVAHTAEATFLLQKVAEMERNGKCSEVRKSITAPERQQQIQEASDWLEKYLESLKVGS